MEVDDPQTWARLEKVTVEIFKRDYYQHRIQDMLASDQPRLGVSIDHFRKEGMELLIFHQPARSIQTIEGILNRFAENELDFTKKAEIRYRISFEGNFGRFFITPRGLKSEFTNRLVKIQGIVIRMSLVRPKLIHSEHYCEKTKKFADKNYSDQYDLSVLQSIGVNNSIPSHDPEGNPYSFEFGLSQYKNYQTLTIQELPERSPTGQLPRIVEVILEDDLVDQVKPGDRVEVAGVFLTVNTASTRNNGTFKTVVIANTIYSVASESAQPQITAEDLEQIKQLASRPDTLEILGKSFAPSIYGHEQIKQALVLLLLGGCEKNLENGTHLRGDVNILLIGDPSTAKSQLLRSVLHTAPLSASTTGRGASGVGLTAAVTRDNETGERHLEAGAMVLADRGVICIDEFDKMNEIDRVAIHEVMEQQTVTIAKAGIHTSLNARCSVVAAANPLYGTYMRDKSPAWNIALPDSLLSRFDLLFVVLDEKDAEIDRRIASKVIYNHSEGKAEGLEDMDLDNPVVEPVPTDDVEEEETSYFVEHEGNMILHRTFLKKFLHYAKKGVNPVLTNEASEYISDAWADLRSRDDGTRQKIVPITVRTLETLIRLSTAIAKTCLSREITIVHCEKAMSLLRFAIYEEEEEKAEFDRESLTPSASRSRRRRDESGNASSLIESIVRTPLVVTEEMKRHVFRIMTENLRGEEVPEIGIGGLWELVQKEGLITSEEHLVDVVKALDHEGMFMYDQEQQNVILIV